MKQLLVVYLGGTFGMQPSSEGLVPAPNLGQRLQEFIPASWLQEQNLNYQLYETTPLLDSSAMRPSDWLQLAALALEQAPKYKGLVIIQGTDTLGWTAAALHYLLASLPIPVVLTASMQPLEAPNSDAPANFKLALQLAATSAPACYVAFAGKALPAISSRKFSSVAADAFLSPAPASVSVPSSMPAKLCLSAAELKSLVQENWQPKIAHIFLHPSLSDSWLAACLQDAQKTNSKKALDGVIFHALGSGNAPLLPLTYQRLQELHLAQFPLGMISQCWQGGLSTTYASSARLLQAGVKSLGNSSPEHAEAHLVYLLALKKLGHLSSANLIQLWGKVES